MVCAIFPNVRHKICMLNEKNDNNKKKLKIKRNKLIVINNRRK
jgi:hypothetical protein